ncbi:MAG: hypothetical protein EKK61_00110 [Rickettsiales bacterium]|nr:MAG: hypothetical protein EKK61_00110 [Rickettsiales bacterium]
MLNTTQVVLKEHLQKYSVIEYEATADYLVGQVVKDPATGDLYKCIADSTGNPLTDTAYFSTISGGGGGSTNSNTVAGTSLTAISSSSTLSVGNTFSEITSSNIILTLPLGSSVTLGVVYYIKVGNVTGSSLTPQGGNLIDGSASSILLAPYEAIQVVWNGTEWKLF